MNLTRRAATTWGAVPVLVAVLAGCGGTPDGERAAPGSAANAADDVLTIYSGRSEELVEPILDRLEAAVGTEVEVRYAGTAELAAQLLEEGDATDADLFFSQDAGALGALARAGSLAQLDSSVLELVPQAYRDSEGQWVATSARARVIAFDPASAPELEQATSADQLLDERYRGAIAYAPTNASFHAFVTALRVSKGEDGARQWLKSFAALDPQAFEGNNDVLDAVDGGQAAAGLINHYYWYQRAAEVGEDQVSARIRFLDSDDPGALVNVAGAGILTGSEQGDAAVAALEFLLSEEAQQYFADETAEYPVREGVTTTEHALQPLGELQGSSVDLNDLDSLDETLALLDEVGLT